MRIIRGINPRLCDKIKHCMSGWVNRAGQGARENQIAVAETQLLDYMYIYSEDTHQSESSRGGYFSSFFFSTPTRCVPPKYNMQEWRLHWRVQKKKQLNGVACYEIHALNHSASFLVGGGYNSYRLLIPNS